MTNIKELTEEINSYKDKEHIYNKLLNLKESYLGTNIMNKSEEDIYSLAVNIIEDLFNPMHLYNEPIIPLSFLKSELGKILLSVINNNDKRILTINDVVEISKTSKNEKGYSYQYINNEIKVGRLQATMYNGRWQITYEEAIRFLRKKDIF
ncbi:hypothetical protein GKZ28_08565 [Clostridium chromiireducens]|jgi:hypothetical protein|uniref:Uncharacterized protein n=1 Tax=Clostridium chromiireducens TaxID=225345 RepID=A0A964RLG0_9CLOT|nr:hypothetical protein [Clostridium chromiireducens]MVX63746.1 hypothetical protein [Clostridium chromiireducens]